MPVEGALRCLREEQGIEEQQATIATNNYRREEETAVSASYPGLLTRYVFHVLEADVPSLPDADFVTNEAGGSQSDPVRRHYWAWRPA